MERGSSGGGGAGDTVIGRQAVVGFFAMGSRGTWGCGGTGGVTTDVHCLRQEGSCIKEREDN